MFAHFFCCTFDTKAVSPNDPNRDGVSTILKPTHQPDYYTKQCDLYFDSLESEFHRDGPKYHPEVIRWEWPPWLLLTGFKDGQTRAADALIRLYPCICVEREHRFFEQQPFGRSVVTFYYGPDVVARKHPIRIYEEFTFNDEGDITFIEAWSATTTSGQLPALDEKGWPTSVDIQRLSTCVPGLGNHRGTCDLESAAVADAAKKNPYVKDLVERSRTFYSSVLERIVEEIIDNRSQQIANQAWEESNNDDERKALHEQALQEAKDKVKKAASHNQDKKKAVATQSKSTNNEQQVVPV